MIDNYISEVRTSMNMSKAELSRRSGLPYSNICKLESGDCSLYSGSVRQLLKLAAALDTDPFNLLKEGD